MRVLDLYCGGGGAALGYLDAGFEVVGVDNKNMPKYPGDFVWGDALQFLADHGAEFDLIHASPPCLEHSDLTKGNRGRGWVDRHVDMIPATRSLLMGTGKPWVIENVVGSGLREDLVLCGTMFGLCLYRHRVFEANFPLYQRRHRIHMLPTWYPHDKRRGTYGKEYKLGWAVPVHGNNAPAPYQYWAMGIMPEQMDRPELIQAIPPAFTRYIAKEFMDFTRSRTA
jgi:hypothetical protein